MVDGGWCMDWFFHIPSTINHKLDIRYRLLLLFNHIPHLLYQLRPGERNTHDFVVAGGVHEILVPYDFNKLAIIELRNQHLLKIVEDMSEVFRERSYITEMRMRNRQSFSL
jgi:hypothetical protein